MSWIEMAEGEYELGKFFLYRLPHRAKIPKAILDFASSKDLRMGVFTLLGALQHAKLAYYDQLRKLYRVIEFQGPHEILSCVGNISLHQGKLFVHAHAILADERGTAKGGHLLEGTVFAAELHLQELKGPVLERMHDPTTGLALWKRSR